MVFIRMKQKQNLAPFDTPQATPGSLRFKDISGPDGLPDGKITSDDMTIIGTAEPKFNYGINSGEAILEGA